jgi:hypothetical protein
MNFNSFNAEDAAIWITSMLHAENAEDCLASPHRPVERGMKALLFKVSSASSGGGVGVLRVLRVKLLILLLILLFVEDPRATPLGPTLSVTLQR